MYRLSNFELRKITSLISVKINGRPDIVASFPNGKKLIDYAFDKPYVVEKIYTDEKSIVIELVEDEQPFTNWIGEEQVTQNL